MRKQNVKTLYKLLEYAIEKETEKLAWQRWLVEYQITALSGQKFISFSDYLKKLKQPKQNYTKMTEKEKREIENKAEALKNKSYKTVEL